VLEAEAVQAALLAAAGEVQAMMNHLGLAARSAPTAKLVFDADMQAAMRRALQFGRTEIVSVNTPLGPKPPMNEPTDIVVAGKARAPQLAVELRWHPRGEDHAGFAGTVMWDIVKMAVAQTAGSVEQATVLIGAPARFWRWLPGFAADRAGYDLLDAASDSASSTKSEFLEGPVFRPMFEAGMPRTVPERLWTSLIDSVEIRSGGGYRVRGSAAANGYAYGGGAVRFSCRTDPRGYVVDVDFNNRQYGYGNNGNGYYGSNYDNPYSAYGYQRY